MVKFDKRVGGWHFEVNGQHFLAVRNVAGFAHRDWELWTMVDDRMDHCLEDQLASRTECVEAAEHYAKPYSSAQQMYFALQVISGDTKIRGLLSVIDPKALSQVDAAIRAYETGVVS